MSGHEEQQVKAVNWVGQTSLIRLLEMMKFSESDISVHHKKEKIDKEYFLHIIIIIILCGFLRSMCCVCTSDWCVITNQKVATTRTTVCNR